MGIVTKKIGQISVWIWPLPWHSCLGHVVKVLLCDIITYASPSAKIRFCCSILMVLSNGSEIAASFFY